MMIFRLAVLMALVVTNAVPAHAHKLVLNVYPGDQRIEGELGYSDGRMAKQATIQIEDSAGNRVGEAVTDDEGFFDIKRPSDVVLVFVANAGGGHVARVEVAAVVAANNTTQANKPGSKDDPAATQKQPGGLTREEVAAVVRAELRAVRQELARLREARDLQTILGGIGYIIGLVGIGYYFAAKARLRQGARDDG